MNVTIVLVDNGDTEPEVWAFRDAGDARAFVAARGGGTTIEYVPVIAYGEARQMIAAESGA